MKSLTNPQRKNLVRGRIAHGGPLDRKLIFLDWHGDGSTAVMRIGAERGMYRTESNTLQWHNMGTE